ncbi:MAG TPA: PRC-barrel domain-containing protein [Candidatus Acidoferrales bacterium]|jgi:sporulation protein YlmC with PRC-barrel domain|nr:PRC-barrel domain-containing protein [Candidatus Acidoferrales bacterium]
MKKEIFAKNLSNKQVMGSDGTDIGTLYDLIVDSSTGDILDLKVKPDPDINIQEFRTENDFIFVPFDAVRAIKDYIVVDRKLSKQPQ